MAFNKVEKYGVETFVVSGNCGEPLLHWLPAWLEHEGLPDRCSVRSLTHCSCDVEAQKGTFYFTRELSGVKVWGCREHREHHEVGLFTMS